MGRAPPTLGRAICSSAPPPQLKRQPPPETSSQTRQKLCLIRASRDSVRSAGKMNYHDRTRWPLPLRLPRAWPLQASFPTLFPTLRHPTRSPVPLAHIGGVARARTLVKPVDASGPSQRARPLCVTGRSPQTPGAWNTTLLGVALRRAPLHLLPRCLCLCPSTELMGSSLLLHAAPRGEAERRTQTQTVRVPTVSVLWGRRHLVTPPPPVSIPGRSAFAGGVEEAEDGGTRAC